LIKVNGASAATSSARGEVRTKASSTRIKVPALAKGRKDLEDREIEADRGRGEHSSQLGRVENRPRPADHRHRAGVLDGHSLGPTGRTRGVDQVGQVTAAGRRPWRDAGKLGKVVDFGIDKEILLATVRGHQITQRAVANQNPWPAVLQDEATPLGWIVGVDRGIGGSRLEYREEGDDQIWSARQHHRDPLLPANPEQPQRLRQPVAPLVELGEGQTSRQGNHRRAVWSAQGGGGHQVDQGRGRRCQALRQSRRHRPV